MGCSAPNQYRSIIGLFFGSKSLAFFRYSPRVGRARHESSMRASQRPRVTEIDEATVPPSHIVRERKCATMRQEYPSTVDMIRLTQQNVFRVCSPSMTSLLEHPVLKRAIGRFKSQSPCMVSGSFERNSPSGPVSSSCVDSVTCSSDILREWLIRRRHGFER